MSKKTQTAYEQDMATLQHLSDRVDVLSKNKHITTDEYRKFQNIFEWVEMVKEKGNESPTF